MSSAEELLVSQGDSVGAPVQRRLPAEEDLGGSQQVNHVSVVVFTSCDACLFFNEVIDASSRAIHCSDGASQQIPLSHNLSQVTSRW